MKTSEKKLTPSSSSSLSSLQGSKNETARAPRQSSIVSFFGGGGGAINGDSKWKRQRTINNEAEIVPVSESNDHKQEGVKHDDLTEQLCSTVSTVLSSDKNFDAQSNDDEQEGVKHDDLTEQLCSTVPTALLSDNNTALVQSIAEIRVPNPRSNSGNNFARGSTLAQRNGIDAQMEQMLALSRGNHFWVKSEGDAKRGQKAVLPHNPTNLPVFDQLVFLTVRERLKNRTMAIFVVKMGRWKQTSNDYVKCQLVWTD